MEGEDIYTVETAARILKLTPGRIRQMLRSGELEGARDEEGRWRILAHAVHDRPRPPRVERARSGKPSSEARESPERLAELESEVRTSDTSWGFRRAAWSLRRRRRAPCGKSLNESRSGQTKSARGQRNCRPS
jgi:excisionase family DNA binding protein